MKQVKLMFLICLLGISGCSGAGEQSKPSVALADPAKVNSKISTTIVYDAQQDAFHGSKVDLVSLAVSSIVQNGWSIETVDQVNGLVSFATAFSFGSNSGIKGTIYFQPIGPDLFKAIGTGKQNLQGGQVFALDVAGEAQSKAVRVIQTMQALAKKK